jgi:hypothetical protein
MNTTRNLFIKGGTLLENFRVVLPICWCAGGTEETRTRPDESTLT